MYQEIRAAVDSEMGAVDRFVIERLESRVPLVENIGRYIVAAGGKRLRPLLVLLAARACRIRSRDHIALAAVIEFIHTATLLHDDVVDMSELRRGRPTVNATWDNPSSVLVGDFMYSRAFQILVELGNMRLMDIMADATNRIAEGEVMQLAFKHQGNPSEADYMRVIENKTAVLFRAASQCAAILAGANAATEDALSRYGLHLGIAYQLMDDLLDYAGETAQLGKNAGDDLAEGKPTLPLIYALAHSAGDEERALRESLDAAAPKAARLAEILGIVTRSGALDYTRAAAARQVGRAREALGQLAPDDSLEPLVRLLDFSLRRTA